jgi:hypothetical protein
MHLFLGKETVLEEIHAFITGMNLKEILTSLILGTKCGGPPYMVFEALLEVNLFALAAPGLISTHDSGFVGIAVDDIDSVHVISGFDIDDQLV